jgi:DNA invertase Pin-like site-specific DNA recombinase
MKYVGYGRASTAKQVASPAIQKQTIADYCKFKKLPFDGAFYIDPATSGKKCLWDRPAGGEMLKVLQKGDHIIVAKLDRMSRSFINFAQILDQLERRGITLHIVDLNGVLDPTNPQSMLTVHILVAMAEFERRMISIRTKEGFGAMKAEGASLGHQPRYGKRWVKKWSKRLGRNINVEVDNENEVAVMRKLFELRVAGNSYDAILQYFNYKLKLKYRKGKEWTRTMLAGACLDAMLRFAQEEALGQRPVIEEDTEWENAEAPEEVLDEDDRDILTLDDFEEEEEEA